MSIMAVEKALSRLWHAMADDLGRRHRIKDYLADEVDGAMDEAYAALYFGDSDSSTGRNVSGRESPNMLETAKDPKIGIGGAPTRATTLPDAADLRKQYPVASGLLDYFPDALVAIANVSWVGNNQHNPGQPLHWARGKSIDEADTMLRHFLERGTLDRDGVRHSAKMAWRALALLQKEIEEEQHEAQRHDAQQHGFTGDHDEKA